MHAKFEELYDDASEKADEIAERILMLGGTPANNFSQYLEVSPVKEITGVEQGDQAIRNILADLAVLIGKEREISKLAADCADEVTVSLMSDYLRGQEKLVWMLTSHLS